MKRESNWFRYAEHKTPEKPRREIDRVDTVLSKEEMASRVIEVSHDPSFLETTRTFAIKVRKYWNI